MSELRKAAEAVLEAWGWDWSEPRNEALKERIEALRQALAMENFSEVNQEIEEALKQTEQEVLVWMNKYGHVSSTQSEEYNAPLYTAPPSIEAAVLAEREACLKEIAIELDEWNYGTNANIALNNVYAAIRARSEK